MLLERVLFRNISGNFIIKAVSVLINILLVPIILKLFNDNSVSGFWFTFASTFTLIFNIDFFGLNNTLRNKISSTSIFNSKKTISDYYSVTLANLILLSSTIIFLNYFIRINEFIGISQFDLIILIFSLSLLHLLKLSISILNADEKTSLATLFYSFPNFLFFIFILLSNFQNIYITDLLYIFIISHLITLVFSFVYVFYYEYKYVKPQVLKISLKKYKLIILNSFPFFLHQVSYLGLVGFNEIIFSIVYDNSVVTEYQIYFRIYNLFIIFCSLISNPYWSRFSVLVRLKNLKKIKFHYRNLQIFLVFFGLIIFIFSFTFSEQLFSLWISDQYFKFDLENSLIFSLFSISCSSLIILSSLTNGLNKIKIQSFVFSIALSVKLLVTVLIYYKFIFITWNYYILFFSLIILLVLIFLLIYNNYNLKHV